MHIYIYIYSYTYMYIWVYSFWQVYIIFLCYEKFKLPICNKFDSSRINIKFILCSKVPVGWLFPQNLIQPYSTECYLRAEATQHGNETARHVVLGARKEAFVFIIAFPFMFWISCLSNFHPKKEQARHSRLQHRLIVLVSNKQESWTSGLRKPSQKLKEEKEEARVTRPE